MKILTKLILLALAGTTLNSFAQKTTVDSIYGYRTVCQGQKAVVYVVNSVTNTTSYTWTYTGKGFSIVSGTGTNAIITNFSDSVTSGILTVHANNACGSSITSPAFSITVNPLPVAPVADSATNIAGRFFTANWKAVAGISAYYLDVDDTPDFSSPLAGYNNRNVGTVTTYSISGLNYTTTYYYRLRAVNACGTGNNSNTIKVTTTIKMFDAMGGTITYTDSNGLNPRPSPPYTVGYTVHTFLSSDTFKVIKGNSDVEYLVVAGGGGGGGGNFNSGGGGGGGFRTGTLSAMGVGNYMVTVGAGGIGGGLSGVSSSGIAGGQSVFSTITAAGGGGGNGGNDAISGGDGGSGGGGFTTGGIGNTPPTNPPQGNNGGINGGTYKKDAGGGGGGANAIGGIGVGGNGAVSSISGVSVTYAGGGGGSKWWGTRSVAGGSGGGGSGGVGYGAGTSGSVNTGGGGGGGAGTSNSGLGSAGGSGGSGIVIVRYKTQ